MQNEEIRKKARIQDVRFWRIAECLGITDSNFSRMLRYELSDEKKQEIFQIIDRLATESKG